MKKSGLWTVAVLSVLLYGLSLSCLLAPPQEYSQSERRFLKKYPTFTVESILSGDFMKKYEEASVDRFPARDRFRTLKAVTAYSVFRRLDNNKIYIEDGYAAKMEYPMNEDSMNHAASCFRRLYDQYLQGSDCRLFFSIIPDKNFFLAEKGGHLTMDYGIFSAEMAEKTSYLKFIDIAPLLSAEDYYKTDTHWKQERILKVANVLAEGMGSKKTEAHTERETDVAFYGVYYGQSALPLPPEPLRYLTNKAIEEMTVTIYDAAVPYQTKVYDMEKAKGKDAYEMFLSGSVSLLTIENPSADTDRELIIFRDSFGSSIAPLLAEGYAKTTLIDIRYLSSELVGRFVDFKNQDVLFLYSTLVLNNSITMR